jgi:hypothetical protein
MKYQDIVNQHDFFKEHITYLYGCYVLAGNAPGGQCEREIRKFIDFCIAEVDEALIAPRGRDETNYLQRAEQERKEEAFQAELDIAHDGN